MARNEEKGHAMLNKWLRMKKDIGNKEKGSDRRPFLATECTNVQEAEKWRREIVRETTKKVAEIQNAGLGEHRIRDLNDAINKLLRERGHWEQRILELGGPNYAASAVKAYDADGRELPGGGGYKYFGAARELPGVRELFQKSAAEAPRRKRGDMYRNITPDYYGYRDDEDGVLATKEAIAEREQVAAAVAEWKAEQAARIARGETVSTAENDDVSDYVDVTDQVEASMASTTTAAAASQQRASAATDATVTAHMPVVSQEDMKKAILAKKKVALLAQFSEA
jgi:pre-mRNA-splicing factor ISY1